MFDADTLRACLPQTAQEAIDLFAEPLANACEEFEINTPERIAMFLAEIAVESGNLHFVKENLNYSSHGLLSTFPKYFNASNASQYERKPEAIANRVYANRMGNGAEQSGDGWKYRGRGLIQITGHNNYADVSQGIHQDVIGGPEYLETPEGASRSAAWFWFKHGLNEVADRRDITKASVVINGGTIGLQERKATYENICQVLGVS